MNSINQLQRINHYFNIYNKNHITCVKTSGEVEIMINQNFSSK